jgi:hypothetical protein
VTRHSTNSDGNDCVSAAKRWRISSGVNVCVTPNDVIGMGLANAPMNAGVRFAFVCMRFTLLPLVLRGCLAHVAVLSLLRTIGQCDRAFFNVISTPLAASRVGSNTMPPCCS